MYYLGWMSLAGQEVFNVDRSMTYLHANAPALQLAGCDECHTLALALGDSPYKNNPVDDPAPWIAADEPDLNDFYGFIPMTMEGLYDSTVEVEVTQSIGHGGTTSTPRMATREIRVTGVLIAGTRIALTKSRGWLRGTLGGSGCNDAGDCGGDDMCFMADCPDSLGQADEYQRTIKDVVLSAGPTMLQPYGQLPSGVWMDSVEFTLTAGTPWIYGQVDFLGSSLGTDGTTTGGNPLVRVGEHHGPMDQIANVVTFPAGTAVGDLLVLTWGSDYPRSTLLPGDWQIMTEEYEEYFSGAVAWKIATASDIATGSLTLTLAGAGGGDWSISAYKAGTFQTDVSSPASQVVPCSTPMSSQKIETLVDSFDRISPEVEAEPGYDDVVIADGPIAYWKMGEASGTAVADSKGYAPLSFPSASGVLRGQPALAPGLGPSLSVDVTTPTRGGLTGLVPTMLTPPFTWEGWIAPDALGYNFGGLISNWPGVFQVGLDHQFTPNFYGAWAVTSNQLARPGTDPATDPAPDPLSTAVSGLFPSPITVPGTTAYLAVVVDATTMSIYHNGVLIGSGPHGDTNPKFWGPGYQPRFILGQAEGGQIYGGRASNWAVYDKTLTAEQIANHWTMGNTAPTPPPPASSQIDPAKWHVVQGSVTWNNGRIRFAEEVGLYAYFQTVQHYDLRDSSIYCQLTPTTRPGSQTNFRVSTGTDSISLLISDGNPIQYLFMGMSDAGVYTAPYVAYDPIDHAWVRYRMTGGVLFWEASPDGIDWLVLRTVIPSPTFNASSVIPEWYVVPMTGAGAPDSAYLDNVNVVHRTPLRVVEHFIKGTSTGTLPQSMLPFTTSPGAMTDYFAARSVNTTAETLACSVGIKEWATSHTSNVVTNSALYTEYTPAPQHRAPVWSATPTGVVTQDGAYYLTLEVLPQSIGLILDPTPPHLPECVSGPQPPITDPTLPVVPPPPRPPALITSLQPPAPYRSGYSLYIPESEVPLATDAVLIITLTTGNAAARWVRLRLYAAPMGATQQIEDLDPCSFCGDVTVMYIPPNSKFVIDGMDQSIYIEDTAGNKYPASHLAYSTGGTPVQWPTVTCAMGYWLTVEFAGETDPANMFITDLWDSSTFNVNLGQWSSGIADGSPRAIKTRDTAQFHLAPASMKVNWPAGSKDRPQVVLNDLTIGDTYKLSAWVKSPTARVTLGIDDVGSVQATPNANWVEIDTLIVANRAQMVAWISRDTSGASGDIWVDEFGLHDVSTVANTIVQVSVATARRE